MTDNAKPSIPGFAGGLTRGQFVAIVSLFWAYVMMSNVLYAYSMRTGIATVTSMPLFAEWYVRVLQHLLLLPALLAAYHASLQVQWRPLLKALPLQILLGLLFAAAAYPAMILANRILDTPDWHQHYGELVANPYSLPTGLASLWIASFVSVLPTYGFGLGLVTGLALYTRFRNAELRVAALESQWAAARLAALRMQLSPHTLFNLLHTIRGHIEWDPKGAQSMVVQLADLLRRLLRAGEHDFTRLTDELQFVRLYLELQQRRFTDRLTVVLPESEVAGSWVPSLILQPLVENAVLHGLAGHQGPVVVRVTAETLDGVLTMQVSNTIARDRTAGEEGIGIKNVRERLAVQFEGRATLTSGPEGSEWRSEITMPEVLEPPERGVSRRSDTGSSL